MSRSSHRRPSASIVIALTALVIAMSGTAIAATSLVSGDTLIKKNSLSGNRLRNHTLTRKQINLTKLGTVPSAAVANRATLADTARNATALDGQPASAYAPSGSLAWTNASLLNGWTQYTATPGNGRPPAYAVDPFGIVHLRGTLANGADGAPAFVLPPSMRPSAFIELPVYTGGLAMALLTVNTDGTVTVSGGHDTAYTSVEGVTFSAG